MIWFEARMLGVSQTPFRKKQGTCENISNHAHRIHSDARLTLQWTFLMPKYCCGKGWLPFSLVFH